MRCSLVMFETCAVRDVKLVRTLCAADVVGFLPSRRVSCVLSLMSSLCILIMEGRKKEEGGKAICEEGKW